MRRTRIIAATPGSGIEVDADPASLAADATAYTVERDKNGLVNKVKPPAVTLISEVVAGPPGGCPECGTMATGRPLRESEDKRHKLYHCEKCGMDFAVTV